MAQIGDNRSGSDSSSGKMDLSLTPQESKPVMGYAAVILGIVGIPFSAVFTVIGIICSFIALFMGQVSLGVIGLLLGLAGIITSPILMGLIGASTIWAWFS